MKYLAHVKCTTLYLFETMTFGDAVTVGALLGILGILIYAMVGL